jgi:hypothetical protein
MCPLTPVPSQTGPPWTASDTLFFYGCWLSNFAPTPGLRLQYGYDGHIERDKVKTAGVAGLGLSRQCIGLVQRGCERELSLARTSTRGLPSPTGADDRRSVAGLRLPHMRGPCLRQSAARSTPK